MQSKIIILPMFWIFFLNSCSANSTHLSLAVAEAKEELSTKEKLIHWIHNRHSPKNLGFDDPYLPSFAKFRPLMISLPNNYKLPEEFVVRDSALDMRSLTPRILEKLSSSDFKNLLDFLARVPVEIKWSDQEGHTQSGKSRKHRAHRFQHWDQSNAAAALALTMIIQQQHEVFINIMTLAPEAILPEFYGHMPGLISPVISAQIIALMLSQLDKGNSRRIAKAIAALTTQGLSYWVMKDMTKLNPYLAQMLHEATEILENMSLPSKEAALGLLLGSVLAGTLKHVQTIKKIDEKRIWIIGVVSNLVWAATSFIACVPLATPVAAATAGGISIGAVLSAALYTALEFPRDFSPDIKTIEGNLEMAALESALVKDDTIRVNTLMMLSWMRAAIHLNGFSD
jgi:hypothetical protein